MEVCVPDFGQNSKILQTFCSAGKRHAVHYDEYAVINDNAHGYSLLTYYISINQQIEQLKQAGFGETEAYDFEGKVQESDTTSPWIYYLKRKETV